MSLELVSQADQPVMKPRSIILDLFGDYLRYAGSEVRAGDLVTLLGAFGVEETTTRMTLSRLRKEGWFTTRRLGRETVYVLSAHMLAVLDEGRERIFAPYDEPWDRTWTTVVLPQGEQPDRFTRDRLRRELAWQGFGPLSPSTWLSPRGRPGRLKDLTESFPAVCLTVMYSRTATVEDDRDLAGRCWDLEGIDEKYGDFLEAYGGLARAAGDLVGEAALVARTTLIAAYRHFPFSDPWLPGDLRPSTWHGEQANTLFVRAHDALAEPAGSFVTQVIGRSLDAPPTRASVDT